MLSVSYCTKVITLSGLHCTKKHKKKQRRIKQTKTLRVREKHRKIEIERRRKDKRGLCLPKIEKKSLSQVVKRFQSFYFLQKFRRRFSLLLLKCLRCFLSPTKKKFFRFLIKIFRKFPTNRRFPFPVI